MNLAVGVLFLWLGGACLWVANNGVDSAGAGWSSIWQTILHGIQSTATAQDQASGSDGGGTGDLVTT